MKFITVTELKLKATQIISTVETTKEQVVVTKNGKPVALIQSISNNAFTLKTNQKGKEVKKHGRDREPRGKEPEEKEEQTKRSQRTLQKR